MNPAFVKVDRFVTIVPQIANGGHHTVVWVESGYGATPRRTNSSSDSGDKNYAMKERDENLKEMDVKGDTIKEEAPQAPAEQQPGFLSKISGGVYSKAATVVGGVGWVAGTALSTTYTAVSAVGGVALNPFRKSQKDKSD